MNILVEQLPETLDVGGIEYPINTDFRDCLRTILAYEDPELTGYEKQIVLLSNLFLEVPEDASEAVRQGLQFLNGGETVAEEDSEGGMVHRLYSFAKDANFIFAAFRQTHGINLQTEKLHWWIFTALFADLGSDTTFCNLIALRKKVKSGKATKEEKAASKELGDIFVIPDVDTRSLAKKEVATKFFAEVEQGQNNG